MSCKIVSLNLQEVSRVMLKSKRKLNSKALRKYYSAYYNDNFMRNFRFIYDKEQSFVNSEGKTITYYGKSINKIENIEKGKTQRIAPNSLLRHRRLNVGTLAGEITYYKNLEDFKQGKIEARFCDRLFFDFDIEDNTQLNALKQEFKKANNEMEGKELKCKYDELQKSFRDLIFNEDLLFDVYHEAQKLCTYLLKYGLKPYLVFSGSKGFHVNVFFDEMQLTNLSQISQTLGMSYKKELDLKYLDFNVFDRERAHKRLQRCQYGVHSKTNLETRPLLHETTYDSMISQIEKNKSYVIDFNFDEMKAPEGFSKMLKKLDHEISFKNAQRQKELEKINKSKRLKLQKKYGKNYKSYSDIDLRDIARSYGIDGKSQGDKLIVKCPFHNDVHPSGVIFKERFHCSTCDLTLNYYAFISMIEGTNDKEKIMKIASKFV